ncbi:AlbA family DNA-binding domain-containing protein [Rubrobacter tropicus]|uniref:AlbA family DNA-binding domain-containing protein n=1 Tax=Rubrobacter tropicus TaxID=2653851 RepID=UPI0014093B0B|nr:ATP-binding protein [Rubrobacter tropicus]
MLDGRPLSRQILADVEAFLAQGRAEDLTLDYKRELGSSKGERAEMCKDVSALANSEGGMIVYGVDENPDRTPKLPAVGTARAFGRQNVEEWVAQVLQGGVQPRMDLDVQAFPLSGDPSRCLLVVRAQPSRSAPHMVTLNGDNRYYGRFYRRGNFGNRIAEEYEVREMMERARRLYLGLEEELTRRGYGDPTSGTFGDSPYNRRLSARSPDGGVEAATQWASFLLLPTSPAEPAFADRASLVDWLDPNKRRYEPDRARSYLPTAVPRPVLGGVATLGVAYQDGRPVDGRVKDYVRVGFDGSVEYGFAPASVTGLPDGTEVPYFIGTRIVAKLWQTLGFAADVRARLSMAAPHLLSVNLARTEGAILAVFAEGWEDPRGDFLDLQEAPRCLEPNAQIRRELRAEDFAEISAASATDPPPQMRELAEEICFAFGIPQPVLFPRA